MDIYDNTDTSTEPRIQFVEDINSLPENTKEFYISRRADNLARIASLPELQKLHIYSARQSELDEILRYVATVPNLTLYEIRADDLTGFEKLSNLAHLDLEWSTKATQLWDISQNPKLETLIIRDFSKLHDLSPLSVARTLTEFELSGGMWNKLAVKSLSPLSRLSNLKKLTLTNIKIEDPQLLQPLSKLTGLTELVLSNQLPVEEYARLSVLLPNTRCSSFSAYETSDQGYYGDKDIMVTGSRKPFLNSKKDAARLQKYEAAFKKLQDSYRSEILKF